MNRRRPGIIFITAMWVIVILGAVVLVFARSMRTEVAASSNRFSVQQADAVELGAEQYVLAAVDGSNGDAVTVLQTQAEQIPIGNGFFWILQTYPDNDYTYAFGITDESSKVNLNWATANSTGVSLANLPGMPQDVADSIVLWHGGQATNTTGQGADANYYQSLPRPYSLKASAFESVDELFLVSHQNVTDQLMYGSDMDHNGMLDDTEQKAAGGLSTAFNAASDTTRGIFPFITAWGGTEPNPKTNPTGGPRVNLTLLPQGPARTLALTAALKGLPQSTITKIVQLARTATRFTSVLDFAAQTQMTAADFDQVSGNFTSSPAPILNGLINVNTAPQQVLATLPTLTTDNATNLANNRGSGMGGGLPSSPSTPGGGSGSASSGLTSYGWLLNAGLTRNQLSRIGPYVTGKSFYYSADIVAVSGEGRGFKRVRIVVNARNSPPIIVYRKDLTKLGWPLSPDILTALRKGQPLPAASGYGTGGANGLGQL